MLQTRPLSVPGALPRVQFQRTQLGALNPPDWLRSTPPVQFQRNAASDGMSDEQVPVLPEVRAEIGRRLKTYLEDHKAAVPWEEVKARLLQP